MNNSLVIKFGAVDKKISIFPKPNLSQTEMLIFDSRSCAADILTSLIVKLRIGAMLSSSFRSQIVTRTKPQIVTHNRNRHSFSVSHIHYDFLMESYHFIKMFELLRLLIDFAFALFEHIMSIMSIRACQISRPSVPTWFIFTT